MSLANKLAPLILGPFSDRAYTIIQFLYRLKKIPNLNDPKSFSEKIQWLKLHQRDPLLPRCVDKYLAREYVAEKVSAEILVPLIGVYERADEVPFDELPESFVLKATHGSGWNIICRSKAGLDVAEARATMSAWLNSNFFDVGREWAYREIQPRVVCETFLKEPDGEPPTDYKFFCFNGEPKFIQADFDRFQGHRRNLYDTAWNLLPCSLEYQSDPKPHAAPALLSDLLEVARKLSADFPFVRVDLYANDGQIYFGELTFYPGKGVERFSPQSYDREFGDLLNLPESQDV